MTTLLPLYVYPADDPDAWSAVTRHATELTTIVNVHNGPGERYDPTYGYAIAALATAGVPRLGYVDLDYGRRPMADVEADIAAWRWYPVDGMFFDQAPSDAPSLDWVGRAAGQVRGDVVLNPGTRPDDGYSGLADLVCTFEGPWLRYRATPVEPDWPNAAHLVYEVPLDEFRTATRRLRKRVAHGLVTDLAMPNPYRGLPAPLRSSPDEVPA
jgi:hypothetical protein